MRVGVLSRAGLGLLCVSCVVCEEEKRERRREGGGGEKEGEGE